MITHHFLLEHQVSARHAKHQRRAERRHRPCEQRAEEAAGERALPWS
jgi:hypothetical protein